jgi:CheY-like chemotaxis protein
MILGMAPNRSQTVLLVDDDPAVIDTFARMLKLEGFAVQTARNAREGLRQAAQQQPDAILLDLRMPFLDGLGFLRQLRADPKCQTTPVAIVTGDYLIEDDVLDAAHALGATVKFKPLWLDELLTVARELVEPVAV